MGGATDLPQRSSSPLKRRASSMEPDTDAVGRDDVDIIMMPPRDSSNPAAMNTSGPEPQTDGAAEEIGAQGVEALRLRGGLTHTTMPTSSAVFALKEGPPPAEEQVKCINTLCQEALQIPLVEDDVCFLISRQWFSKFLASGGDVASKKAAAEGPLGPIDNSDITWSLVHDVEGKQAVRLKPGMVSGENFEILPEAAWDLLVEWHGLTHGQIPIRRVAHNTAPPTAPTNILYEFNPPVFTLHRIALPTSNLDFLNGQGAGTVSTPPSTSQESAQTKPPPRLIQCSTSYKFQHFWREAKRVAGVPPTTRTRLWQIPPTVTQALPSSAPPAATMDPNLDPALQSSSDDSGPGTPKESDGMFSNLYVTSSEFQQLGRPAQRDLLDHKDETSNEKYNGGMTLDFASLTTDRHLVIDDHLGQTKWASTVRDKDIKKASSPAASLPASRPKQNGLDSGRSSPGPRGAAVTRARAKGQGRTIGCVGLSNLGNTCYMNSALQCIRSVEELTKYFLVNESQKEINRDNPLGYNGDVAVAYGELLEDIYKIPTPSSVAPRPFKSCVGRYNPTFSGYGQQDSQEFVNFLLDGLREDLNRVLKKPYVEVPDSTDDMIGNPAAIHALGQKVWEINKGRDDSVIHDLFTGMYQSSLVCPTCDKVSLVFENFNSLTLPLPIKGTWSRHVKYFPLNDYPIFLDIEIDKDETISGLKKFVSGRVGIPTERLMVAEQWKERFYKFYEEDHSVSEEIASNDIVQVWEIEAPPINPMIGQKKGKKKLSSMLDVDTPPKEDDTDTAEDSTGSFIVPVYHRFDPSERRGGDKTLPAHFICVTPAEARNLNAIRRKVLEKVGTFSSWPGFVRANEDCANDEDADQVMVPTASEDADSAGEGRKVVARSVESEEDMVDVTMPEAAQSAVPASDPNYPNLLYKFNSRRPKWVDPNQFLAGDLQQLFSMSYFTARSDTPNNWSFTENSNMPSLESRMPAPPTPALSDVDMRSPGPANDDSDSDQDDTTPEVAQELTRMADESEEDEPSPIQNLTHRARPALRVGGGPRRGGRTYGKRGRVRRKAGGLMHSNMASRQRSAEVDSRSASPSDDAADGGPLIRPHEGLVVNWTSDAYDTVFSPKYITHDPSSKEPLEDRKLDAKRKARNAKRKNGVTLDDCLDAFEKEETLSENNMWYCPRCKEHRQAKKKMVLWKTPDILVIHLKRFYNAGYRRDKLDMQVNFPIEGLDLTQRLDETSAKRNNEIYDLIAVDDHWGGLNGGHYTAYAKNFIDGEWYDFNDSMVNRLSDPQKVVSPAAYLLFYRRRSEEPLGGERYKEILARYDNQVGEDGNMSDAARDPLGSSSQLRGGSGALKGKGVALSRGLNGFRPGMDQDDSLPAYHQIGDDDEAVELEDNPPPLERPGLGFNSDIIRQSIEPSDVNDSNRAYGVGWTFGNLGSGQGDTGLSGEGSEATNVDSMDPALGDLGDQDLTMTSVAQDTDIQFPNYGTASEELPPAPAGLMEEISSKAWANKSLHEVPAEMNVDEDSGKAVSIRVEDNSEMD